MSKWPHLEFYMETQKTSNSQNNFKNRARGTTLSDFRLYYKAIVVKAVWYWYKNRHTSMEQDRAQENKKSTYLCSIYSQGGKNIQWRKDSLFIIKRPLSISGTYTATCKRIKLEHSLTLYTKINSKWIKDLNVRPDIIKLLEENTGRTHFDINCSNIYFFDQSPKEKEIKAKINKRNHIKLKSFWSAKETIAKTKTQSTEWEKMFANDITDKGLTCNI